MLKQSPTEAHEINTIVFFQQKFCNCFSLAQSKDNPDPKVFKHLQSGFNPKKVRYNPDSVQPTDISAKV